MRRGRKRQREEEEEDPTYHPPGSLAKKKRRTCTRKSSSLPIPSFNLLPNELHLLIFSFLPPHTILHITPLVCKAWRALSNDDGMWRNFHVELFGKNTERTSWKKSFLCIQKIKRKDKEKEYLKEARNRTKKGWAGDLKKLLAKAQKKNILKNIINAPLSPKKGNNCSQFTLLHFASQLAVSADIVKVLLAFGADPFAHAWGKNGPLPLHFMAWKGQEEMTKILLQHIEANENTKDKIVELVNDYSGGKAPLVLAAQSGNRALCELLISKGAVINNLPPPPSIVAQFSSTPNTIPSPPIMYSSMPPTINLTPSNCTSYFQNLTSLLNTRGSEALVCAVSQSHAEVTRLLLSHKADPNTIYTEGLRPLHLTAISGCLKISKLLFKFGARDKEQKRGDGRYALWYAAVGGHEKLVERILNQGEFTHLKEIGVTTQPDYMALTHVGKGLMKFGFGFEKIVKLYQAYKKEAEEQNKDMEVDTVDQNNSEKENGTSKDNKNCKEKPLSFRNFCRWFKKHLTKIKQTSSSSHHGSPYSLALSTLSGSPSSPTTSSTPTSPLLSSSANKDL